MKIRNAFRILTDNFNNVYKLLLYRTVVGILSFALSYVVLSFGLRSIIVSEELQNVLDLIGKFFTALFNGQSTFLAGFNETFWAAVWELWSLVLDNLDSLVGSIVGVCAIYLLGQFLNGMALFSLCNVYNDKMELFSKTHFSTAYFKNIGRAVIYQLINVPISFLIDVLAFGVCGFCFFYLPVQNAAWNIGMFLFGTSATLCFMIVVRSLKVAFFSPWMPASFHGKSVGKGFASCFGRGGRGCFHRFLTFLVADYLIVVLNVACALFSLGSFLLISIPASYLFLLCLQLVYYYEQNGKRYYLSFNEFGGVSDHPEGFLVF